MTTPDHAQPDAQASLDEVSQTPGETIDQASDVVAFFAGLPADLAGPAAPAGAAPTVLATPPKG